MIPDLRALPGGELVMQGLHDLASGRGESIAALLVRIAHPRLVAAGLSVPNAGPAQDLELKLYEQLVKAAEEDPYRTYNSLLRELTSCAAALERGLHRPQP